MIKQGSEEQGGVDNVQVNAEMADRQAIGCLGMGC